MQLKTEDNIRLAHGSGGTLTHNIIKEIFLPYFGNEVLNKLDDAAVIKRLAITTDSFVVEPIFFRGGDIGKLAVFGSVNDLAMVFAKPLFLAVSFIVVEGFPLKWLKKIAKSISEAAKQVGVDIICGDFKVIEGGMASLDFEGGHSQGKELHTTKLRDDIYITTTGIGEIQGDLESNKLPQEGDDIIVSGPLGEHECAIIISRGDFPFEVDIKSDCAPLWEAVQSILPFKKYIKFLRDITRGGLGTVINEIAEKFNLSIFIEEERIPFSQEVLSICEVLGIDKFYLASEGRFLLISESSYTEDILKELKKTKVAKNACKIGMIKERGKSQVILKTSAGANRVLLPLSGIQTPRIC